MSAVAPRFEVSRCVRYRFRYSACRRCADACPHDAIALDDAGAKLDAARCRNCALCAGACRTAAFRADNFPRVDILKQAIRQERFRIACAPSALEADAVVPCLGAVDAPSLAYLAWRGIPVELHGSDHCGSCPHGACGATQVASNLEAVETLRRDDPARPWAAPQLCRAEEGKRGDRKKFRADRRQLFRRLTARGLDQALRPAADQPVPEKAIRPGAWFVPEARELLQIVCRADENVAWPVVPHEALPLMALELRSGCTACEVCTRACPTGALQVREDEERWTLQFEYDRCVACGVCLDVCQPGVLRSRPAFNAAAAEPATLHRLAKQRCRRCDRFFVSPVAQDNCAVCRDDDEAFAAIFG